MKAPLNKDNSIRKPKKMRLRKGLSLLPNAFTLSNAFLGFCSLTFASLGNFVMAAYCILFGALMDALDGRIARLTQTTSEIGMQLDSLCDAITFCLAPAFLMYHWNLKYLGIVGFASCSAFLLAGIMRLARFNATHQDQTIFFSGLTTTMAGCFLATVILNIAACPLRISPSLFILIMPFLSYLMVSRIKYPSFKHISRKQGTWALALIGCFIVVTGLIKPLFFIFIFYFSLPMLASLRKKFASTTPKMVSK